MGAGTRQREQNKDVLAVGARDTVSEYTLPIVGRRGLIIDIPPRDSSEGTLQGNIGDPETEDDWRDIILPISGDPFVVSSTGTAGAINGCHPVLDDFDGYIRLAFSAAPGAINVTIKYRM